MISGLLLYETRAQMPDWVPVRDPGGNLMYLDGAGRFHTPDLPQKFPAPSPVSAETLEYHYARAVELIAGHKKSEGLRILKSILALNREEGRTAGFKRKASREINRMIRNEGDRFEKLNGQAALYLVREGDEVFLHNDLMRYRLSVRGSVEVIRWRSRAGKGYRYYGVLLGVRFAGGDPGRKGYDCVVGMDSETFPHPPGTLGRVELHWRNTLGADTFDREEALREEERKIYRFGDREAPHYRGYEAFMVRGRYGYCVRVLSSKQLFDANRELLYRLAEGIKII